MSDQDLARSLQQLEGPRVDATAYELHVIRRFEAIEDRLDRGSDRMKAIEVELRENTDTTKEVRELLEVGRSGFKVLGWIGVAAKWLGGVAVAVGAIWSLLHGVQPPGK